MAKLETPDLCARLDRIKILCDRLEKAQHNPEQYRDLLRRIRIETKALHETICDYKPREGPSVGRD